MHLLDRGDQVKQTALNQDKKENCEEDFVKDIDMQRRRIDGEEKRINQEMERQKEIDMMYELLNVKNAGERSNFNKDITFDHEGKIIQIKKPNENNFPDTLSNPKVRFKQAIV